MGRLGSDADREAFEKEFERGGEGGCWNCKKTYWTGYGRNFRFQGKPQAPYRVSYQLYVGPIPPHADIDHLCRNKACVNPDHLEAVTHAENSRRNGIAQTGRVKPHIDGRRHLIKLRVGAKEKLALKLYAKHRGIRQCEVLTDFLQSLMKTRVIQADLKALHRTERIGPVERVQVVSVTDLGQV